MNLNETKDALKVTFVNRLYKEYSRLFNYKEDIDNEIITILRDYVECGGIIDKGSALELSQQMVEQRGMNLSNSKLHDQLYYTDKPAAILYSDAIKRNSNLTLEQLRNMIDNYFNAVEEYGPQDIEKRLNNMRDYVECGGVMSIYIANSLEEEIRNNTEDFETNIELLEIIKSKSSENEKARDIEQTPLSRREAELVSLEREGEVLSKELEEQAIGVNIGER